MAERKKPTKKKGAKKSRHPNADKLRTEILRASEENLEADLREAPEAAVREHFRRHARRVLWAHFEALARGPNDWPRLTPDQARADLEHGEVSIEAHLDELVQLVVERWEGLHGTL